MTYDLTPICLNSSFRTSSTWVWTRFRKVDDFIAYSEPFNEALGAISREIHTADFSKWRSRHPPSAPYFLEYMPIMQKLSEGALFDPTLSYDRFIPAGGFDGTLSQQEVTYLSVLIDHAHALGRRPVLGFTRSLARAGALKRAFPGKSIFLHRNLFHQWASYSGQAAHGNNYFFDRLNDCVRAGRHDPIVAMLDDWLSPREARPTDRNNFLVFLLFHLYIYICAFSAADLIIDSTRVSYDRHAREEAETGLHTLLGRQISLDGAKPSFDMSQLDLKCSKVDRDLVEQFLRMILPKNIDNACHAFLHQAMNDTFMEWEKNEFYSSGMRGVLVSKIAELDNVNHRLNNVSNQCDHVVHERDEARNLLQLEVTQREGLLQDLKQLHSITNERDSFAHERDEARNLLQLEAAQREGLLQDLKQLHSECNRLEALAQDSARESAAQAERFETLSQENQRLLVELDRQRTACGRHVYAVQQHLDIVQQRYSHFWPRLAFGALMAHVFLSLARRAARRHEWSRAASWYRALLARAPLNFAAWRQYGNMQREQGHLDEAARAYAITLLRYPQDEEVRGWERQINLQRQKERSPEHS